MSNAIIALENQNITDTDSFSFENPDLREYTKSIQIFAFDMRTNALRIASILATIQDNADVLCDEFIGDTPKKRFYNYGETVIGLKQAQLLNYARVGHEFLDEHGIPLVYEPSNASYTISQLYALLPLGSELANSLAIQGEIAPTMTISEIKEVVEAYDPKADEKAAKKAMREAAKAEKEEKERKEQAKVNGELLHEIKIHVLESGAFVVNCDGQDITKSNIGKYLIKNLCK